MALSVEDAALLANLKAARAAKLAGRSVASISSGGRSVSYETTPLADIEAAIARLTDIEAGGAGSARGALRFKF